VKLAFAAALNFLKNPSTVLLRAHMEAVLLYYNMNCGKLISGCL